MTLVIHAPNVHQGGGAVLLCELLSVIPPETSAVVLIDERMKFPDILGGHIRIKRIRPTVFSRFMAEIWLFKKVVETDKVLCFGNLPPLFKLSGRVSVFLQNRYLVDERAPLKALPLNYQVRIGVEKRWLTWCRDNAHRYFVQTPSMQRLAEQRLGLPVTCFPFAPEGVAIQTPTLTKSTHERFDFLYVASGESHKNHKKLIGAWRILAEEGLFPSLALTLCNEAAEDLLKYVDQERIEMGLRIHNVGLLPHDQMLSLYKKSDTLIYPSSFESYGLPLIEARHAGLPVLAPELDYVRDIIDPEETFNPESSVSIARAVKRHLLGTKKCVEQMGAKLFFDSLMNVDTQ